MGRTRSSALFGSVTQLISAVSYSGYVKEKEGHFRFTVADIEFRVYIGGFLHKRKRKTSRYLDLHSKRTRTGLQHRHANEEENFDDENMSNAVLVFADSGALGEGPSDDAVLKRITMMQKGETNKSMKKSLSKLGREISM